jgi:hypothetical protein
MGVFDDDDDEDIVADWDAFDAVVAQHQQKKQVLGKHCRSSGPVSSVQAACR